MFALCATAPEKSSRGPQTLRLANWFALCKLMGAMDTPTKFAEAAGISIPYACQLLNGKRKPSQSLAIRIFRRTGRKFGPIANLPDDVIAQIEQAQEAA